jgi:hypothetical protein
MPCITFCGVSRFIRPHWSSGPKSPQVDPAGRCFQRADCVIEGSSFVMAGSIIRLPMDKRFCLAK